MMRLKKLFSFSNLTLLVALTLSCIAAWYSILGLTAIFAAAVIPVMIMGGSLEIAKVVATVWLHRYWNQASLWLKIYLIPAVAVLALITSMGIYGFLSKAHLDQTLPTSDVAAQVSLLDDKIVILKENIEFQRTNIASARASLSQMDSQVSARLDRGTSEASAERAVQIRRQQARERSALNQEIIKAQQEIEKLNAEIAALNEQKAPIATKLRQVEAEVGPIKYIAALIYGDTIDQTMLEKAVRWVIILLVLVFDPLALCLVIASIQSKKYEEDQLEIAKAMAYDPPFEKELEETKETEPVIKKKNWNPLTLLSRMKS